MPYIITNWEGAVQICKDLSLTEDIEGPHDVVKVERLSDHRIRVAITRRQAKRLRATDLQEKYDAKRFTRT